MITQQAIAIRKATLYLFATTACLVVTVTNLPLLTQTTPWGIVSLTFASTPDVAREMIRRWNPTAIKWARIGLACDFVNLVLYSAALGCLCISLGRKLASLSLWLPAVCGWIACLTVVAAVCDSIENLGLFMQLQGHITRATISVVWWCAAIKFGVVAIILAWLVVGTAIQCKKLPLEQCPIVDVDRR